jgi:hypothetical protein
MCLIVTLSIMAFNTMSRIVMLSKTGSQHNDSQHHGTLQNDAQNDGTQQNDAWHSDNWHDDTQYYVMLIATFY